MILSSAVIQIMSCCYSGQSPTMTAKADGTSLLVGANEAEDLSTVLFKKFTNPFHTTENCPVHRHLREKATILETSYLIPRPRTHALLYPMSHPST